MTGDGPPDCATRAFRFTPWILPESGESLHWLDFLPVVEERLSFRDDYGPLIQA